MRWSEVLAALTIAGVIYAAYTSRPSILPNPIGNTRPIHWPSWHAANPGVREKIAAIQDYRDYENLVVSNGRVIGGL